MYIYTVLLSRGLTSRIAYHARRPRSAIPRDACYREPLGYLSRTSYRDLRDPIADLSIQSRSNRDLSMKLLFHIKQYPDKSK